MLTGLNCILQQFSTERMSCCQMSWTCQPSLSDDCFLLGLPSSLVLSSCFQCFFMLSVLIPLWILVTTVNHLLWAKKKACLPAPNLLTLNRITHTTSSLTGFTIFIALLQFSSYLYDFQTHVINRIGLYWNNITAIEDSKKFSRQGKSWKIRVDRSIKGGNPENSVHKSILCFYFLRCVFIYISVFFTS